MSIQLENVSRLYPARADENGAPASTVNSSAHSGDGRTGGLQRLACRVYRSLVGPEPGPPALSPKLGPRLGRHWRRSSSGIGPRSRVGCDLSGRHV